MVVRGTSKRRGPRIVSKKEHIQKEHSNLCRDYRCCTFLLRTSSFHFDRVFNLMNVTPVLVLDNGASTIKTNVVPEAGSSEPQCFQFTFFSLPPSEIPFSIITNAIIRQSKGTKQTFFGHEFDSCDDFASLHYRLPFERVRVY